MYGNEIVNFHKVRLMKVMLELTIPQEKICCALWWTKIEMFTKRFGYHSIIEVFRKLNMLNAFINRKDDNVRQARLNTML